MKIEVRRLDESLTRDFFRLHGSPPFAWCFCAAWAVPHWEGWGERSAAENRAVRERLFAAGRYDGYLLYVDGDPVGWCQCAPLGWFPKLVDQKRRTPAEGTYAVSCFCIAPEHRRRGLAHHLLEAVLEDLERRGARRVEAYPRHGSHPDGEAWTGPEAVFHRAGFREESRDERYLVMVRELA